MTDIKLKLYNSCLEYVAKRLNTAQHAIVIARESANDDTKSSAGDKYETGREMMQQEISRNQTQIEEAQRLKQVLDQIHPCRNTEYVSNGSLVLTNRGSFYLAISAGQLLINGNNYYAVSAASPIGSLLKGRKAGDEFNFNLKQYIIQQVY